MCSRELSTKGNVTLQTWEVTPNDITVIGDVNPDKDGSYTPVLGFLLLQKIR